MSFFKSPFNWFNKFGTIPESYTEAMSYEEQIMWLCKEIKDNEGFIDEFRQEFQDVSTILQEMQDAINDNILAITDLQNNKQDVLLVGKGISIESYPFNDNSPEISTSPLDYNFQIQEGAYIDIHNLNVGDTVNLTPVSASNTSYVILDVEAGDVYDFIGNFDFAEVNDSNEITIIQKDVTKIMWKDCFRFYAQYSGKVIVSFWNTNDYEAGIRRYVDTEFLVDEINKKQNKLIAGEGITIYGDTISADSSGFAPINITDYVTLGSYIDINTAEVGDTISLVPVSASNTAYYIKEVVTGEKLLITGKFDIVKIDSDNKVTFKNSATAIAGQPVPYESLSAGRIVISFYDTNTYEIRLEEVINSFFVFENIDWNQQIHKLPTDVYLADGNPSTGLMNGLYYTGDNHVYLNNNHLEAFDNSLFYVYANQNISYNDIYIICGTANNVNQFMFQRLNYNNGTWSVRFVYPLTEWSKVNSRPTINNLTADVNLVDGVSSCGLSNGLYYADIYCVYENNNHLWDFDNSLFLVYNDNLYLVGAKTHTNGYIFGRWFYDSANSHWAYSFTTPKTTWENVMNKPAGMENYSTSEQVIGTWINGKPLYEKILSGTLGSYSTSTITTDLDVALNVETAFIHEAFLINSSGTATNFPVIAFDVDPDTMAVTDKSNKVSYVGTVQKVRIIQNNSQSDGRTYYIRVRYTKTTD